MNESLTALCTLIIGVGLVIGGIYLIGNSTLSCQWIDVAQVNCTLSETHWFGSKLTTTTWKQIQGAESLHYGCDRNGQQACSHFIFITRNGKIEVEQIKRSFISDNIAAAINQFISSSQQSTLTLTKEFWLHGLLVIGMGMISLANTVRFIFLRQQSVTKSPQKG